MTLLGIALPVYNGADYLREALDSILCQEYRDFVLVVSDNCSTDATPNILAEYALRDNRINVSRTDEFISQAENVNRAVELCEATWVKLFCHDDIMYPCCLRIIYETIASCCTEEVALIGDAPGWQFENGYRHSNYPITYAGANIYRGADFIKRNLGGHSVDPLPALSTATVRREVFLKSQRFDAQYMHFDVFLWSTVLVDWDYVFVPQFICVTRIHGAQVAVDARKSLKTILDAQKFWPDFTRKYGKQLNIDRSVLWRAYLKGTAAAGTTIAIAIMKKRLSAQLLLMIVWSIPFLLVPILPIFILRSLINEKSRVSLLAPHVPIDLIYPG